MKPSEQYDPDGTDGLSSLLGASTSVAWNQYLAYWEITDHARTPTLTPEQRNYFKRLNDIGRALRQCLHSLSADHHAVSTVRAFLDALGVENNLSATDTLAFLKTLYCQEVVRDCIMIQLAFEATDQLLIKAEQRAPHLVALLALGQLSARASSYLDRATRLFLWGFDPECIAMSRSVLEAALLTRLEDVVHLDQPPPSLEKLIALAGKNQLLPGWKSAANRRGWRAAPNTLLWDAERIRWAGNRVMHDHPSPGGARDEIKDAQTAIQVLTGLLEHLFPAT